MFFDDFFNDYIFKSIFSQEIYFEKYYLKISMNKKTRALVLDLDKFCKKKPF